MLEQGAEGYSYPPWVCSGPHSPLSLCRSTDRAIQRDELVQLTFGAKYAGLLRQHVPAVRHRQDARSRPGSSSTSPWRRCMYTLSRDPSRPQGRRGLPGLPRDPRPVRLRELHPLRPGPRDRAFGGRRPLARPAGGLHSSSPTCSSTSTSGSRTASTACASRTGCWSPADGLARAHLVPQGGHPAVSGSRTRPPSAAPSRSDRPRSWPGRRPSSAWRARTVRPPGARRPRRISWPGECRALGPAGRGVPAHGRAGHRGPPLLAGRAGSTRPAAGT